MKAFQKLARLPAFIRSAQGSTAIEYALIASLIFLAIIGGLTLFTDAVGNLFTTILNAVTGA